MATAYLGPRITIHGGGSDLIFPHHTCEIAQSEHATGARPYVQTWMHCAMVALEGEKMSKSLGNLVLAANLLERYTPDAVRIMLLTNHYRRPWEYFAHEMASAAERARRFTAAAARVGEVGEGAVTMAGDETALRAHAEFNAALDNDLRTPAALAILDVLATATLSTPTPARVATLRELGGVLGLTLGGVNPTGPAWTLN
jgi:L-cysteine:1D-myo-inositol 2-amino-2-deoxy-alpha-D-glucopyranoside ligase